MKTALTLALASLFHPMPSAWAGQARLCLETGIRGPRTTDAWYAALAIESGCTWVTLDRDFGRFPGLRWVHLV